MHPFELSSLSPPGFPVLTLTYNVSCADLEKLDMLTVGSFYSAWGNNTLVYWACQDLTLTASYTIYLAGLYGYANKIGKITCVINPIQSTLYSVMYRLTEDIFSATEANASSPKAITFPTLINDVLLGLGVIVSDSQNYDANLFAEPILDFGLRSFGPSADLVDVQPVLYLSICEQMI